MRTMLFSLGAFVFLTGSLAADEALPAKTLAAIKRATVFIEVEAEGHGVSGSGFVVKVEGTSALIVTNHHVVEPKIVARTPIDSKVIPVARPRTVIRPVRPPGSMHIPQVPRQPVRPGMRIDMTPRVILRTLKNAAVTVVFDSGTKDEQSVKAELLAIDPGFDLAVLRVKDVKNLPEPIDIEKDPDVTETMPVFTFGFPFGKALATNKNRPVITVGKATISSLREDDDGDLALVQIDGSLNPGNSGGPIVNSSGELVGVAVATIRDGDGIGLAIASGPLQNMFAGRIGAIFLARNPKAEKPALAVEVGVVDPLSRITSVALHYIGMSRVKLEPDKRIESLDAVPGSEQAKLILEKQLASGEIAPDSLESEKELLVQVAYTTADGKAKRTRVYRYPLQSAATAAQNPAPGEAGSPGSTENVTGKESRIYGVALDPVFKDVAPDGALLVGFELGLAKFGGIDIIKAIRPVYRTAHDKAGDKDAQKPEDEDKGNEGSRNESRGKQFGTNLDNVVTVKAKEGYAVGGMSVRYAHSIFGLSLTYMRVKDSKLDPTDSYESDWTGNRVHGINNTVTGNGRPIVGIACKANDADCTGVGLLFDRSSTIDKDSPRTIPVPPGVTGGGDPKNPTRPFNPAFKDQAPDKALLIGFEIGLGPLFDKEIVKALRPIYRTEKNEEALGNQYGTNLNRVIVVKAKEGYAVGGVKIKSLGYVYGVCVSFMRVGDGKLDSADSYDSDWIGDTSVRGERTTKGNGTPVIGIAGRQNELDCTDFELVFAKQTAAAAGGRGNAGVAPGKEINKQTGAFDPFLKDRAPEGGVLIGFEIGLAEAFNREVVKALRPIYRTEKEEAFGAQYGTDLHKVVTVKAKEGYAVAGMTVGTGVFVFTSGISVKFFRINDGKLDPTDSYESEWFGDLSDQTRKRAIKATGTPVIGIVGRQSEKDFLSLELLFEKRSDATAGTLRRNPSFPDNGATQDSPNRSGRGRNDQNANREAKILGGGFNPTFKDEAPQECLLIGFEIGTGTFLNADVVKAIRPIYRTGKGQAMGQQFGTDLDNVVSVKAKDGYAVGSMTVRAGSLINGLSLTFMRVKDGKLDPADSYESDWIGDRKGGSETAIKGDGTPVIGIVGKANDKDCLGLGLLFEKK